jgi:hypothetical protein
MRSFLYYFSPFLTVFTPDCTAAILCPHNNPSVFTLDNPNAFLGGAAIAWLLLTTLPIEAKFASIAGTPWLLKTYNAVIRPER